MGDHADDAINQIMDDLEAWDNGEYDEPPEAGYPMFHPWWGDRARHSRPLHFAKAGDPCIAKEVYGKTVLHCSGKFVVRTNGRTGKKFLGCSHFPNCRQTAEIKDARVCKDPPYKGPSRQAEREGKRALEEYDREMNRMPDVPDCEL